MPSPVEDPQLAAALTAAEGAIGCLVDVGVPMGGIVDTYAVVRQVERLQRRLAAIQVGLVNAIEDTGIHAADGHASAKVLVRFAANLPDKEAARRNQAAKALRRMPLVAAGFAAGDIGQPQVQRIARTFANPRVRDELIEEDANVAVLAHRLPYVEFDQRLAEWERLTDADGAGDAADRAHRRRKFRIYTDFDGSGHIEGKVGALQRAEMQSIHQRFVEQEFAADWAEARERLGDAATVADLRRTNEQREADAALAAWRLAADAHAAEPGGSVIVTNIVMDQETLDRELAALAGADPGADARARSLFPDAVADLDAAEPDADADAGTGPRPSGRRLRFQSGTEDGAPIHPSEATAAALLGHMRRVVIGADGVVLEMGRLRRLFTGSARAAVMLSAQRCQWVGCLVPTSACQADHLEAFHGSGHGSTDPGNGAPACGRHNRFKERGFALVRDERGRMHVFRPDGTEIR